jgi:hypothetical protein
VTASTTARPSSGSFPSVQVALSLQGGDHTARGALVQAEVGGEVAEARRTPPNESLDRVALGHRDIVAADAIPIAELVDPDELRKGIVEPLSLVPKGRFQLDAFLLGRRHCRCYYQR